MPNNASSGGHVVAFVNYLVIASLVIIFVTLLVLVGIRLKEPIMNSFVPPKPKVAAVVDTNVSSWVPYENTNFNVSFEIPAGWNLQDYSAFINNGGAFVAYSPSELPCSTCSYLNNGYFSLRVYNEKTDPPLFALFSQKVKQSQDNPAGFKNITLDGKTGLLYQNSVVVENEGFIYEVSLDANEGKDPIEESPIMKHIFSTWKFTKLFGE